MNYFLEIGPTLDSESSSILLFGIKKVTIDRNGHSRYGGQFSRIDISYLNGSVNHYKFKPGDDELATSIYNQIRNESSTLYRYLTEKGHLNDLFK